MPPLGRPRRPRWPVWQGSSVPFLVRGCRSRPGPSSRCGSRFRAGHDGRIMIMRKLSIIEFVTLDGVTQGLGGPQEDTEGGFEYGGWSAPYGDEVFGRSVGQCMSETTAYLFGRKTYEKMAAHWPNEPDS